MHQRTSQRQSSQRGSALIGIICMIAIGFISMIGFMSFQGFLSNENRSVSQKLEAKQIAQKLNVLYNHQPNCTPQVQNIAVAPDPDFPGTLFGVFPPGRNLTDGGGNVIAEVGGLVDKSTTQLPVSEIRIAGLTKVDSPSPAYDPDEYIGYIQIRLGNVANYPQALVRPIKPIMIKKKFVITGGVVQKCSDFPPEIDLVDAFFTANGGAEMPSNGVTSNTLLDSMVSVARCPAGMRSVGGGFKSAGGTLCPPDDLSVVLANGPLLSPNPSQPSDGWQVMAICRSIRAFALCYRGP